MPRTKQEAPAPIPPISTAFLISGPKFKVLGRLSDEDATIFRQLLAGGRPTETLLVTLWEQHGDWLRRLAKTQDLQPLYDHDGRKVFFAEMIALRQASNWGQRQAHMVAAAARKGRTNRAPDWDSSGGPTHTVTP